MNFKRFQCVFDETRTVIWVCYYSPKTQPNNSNNKFI